MNPKMRKKVLEEQKKRQRDLLQKKMSAGVDFLGDADVKLDLKAGNLTIFDRISAIIADFLEYLKPFKKDMIQIRANYDTSIILFYEIQQQMYVFTIITALLNGYLVVIQAIDDSLKQEHVEGWGCGYMWYCRYFFSRY